MKLPPVFSAIGLALTLLSSVSGKSLLPGDPIPLDSFAAFASPGANWMLAGGLSGDPRRDLALEPTPGTGVLVNVAPESSGDNLRTSWEHGDIELAFEFLLPPKSNSGVYLMGRYEVQLIDSWGVDTPTVHDCGAIYQRWITAEKRGYEGSAPRANASRAPGLWQTMRIVFQAPRFDQSGKKIASARFLEVEHNGFLIHQNVEVTGPTRGAVFSEEAASGPILIQGDHGPIAFRHFTIRRSDPANRVTFSGLESALKTSDDSKAAAATTTTEINLEALGESTDFSVDYVGQLTLPNAGLYAFDAETSGSVSLKIDGQPALVPPGAGPRTAPLTLTAGGHNFELRYKHGRRGRPSLDLFVEGPGVSRQRLTPPPPAKTKANAKPTEIIVSPPAQGVRLQRGFTPFDPKKRLYSISVGSSQGVHYAYDFDTATILRTWSGPFLDLFEFWDGRAQNQYTTPIGPALTFNDLPTIALLERPEDDWPHPPDAMWASDGYTLDPAGNPTFLARLSDLNIEDKIVATSAPRRLDRTLKITGSHTSWTTGVLLAIADQITAQPGGQGYVIGDRGYYIDLPATGKLQPFVRQINGRAQLILLLPKSGKAEPLTYSVIW